MLQWVKETGGSWHRLERTDRGYAYTSCHRRYPLATAFMTQAPGEKELVCTVCKRRKVGYSDETAERFEQRDRRSLGYKQQRR